MATFSPRRSGLHRAKVRTASVRKIIEDEFPYFAGVCDMGLRRLRAAGRALTARAHSVGWINCHRQDFDKLCGTPEFAFGLCDSTRTDTRWTCVYGVLC